MRICRFSTGEEPRFGVVTGDVDEFGQPAEDSVVVALGGDPLYVGIKILEEQFALSDVRLLAPIIPRSKVVGIGKNYAAHAAEMGGEVPAEPLMFLKPNTTVVGPGDAIFYPPQTSDLHYEGELAVVIGRICRDVPLEQATDVIFGYTIANGFDSFCPLGPWIETDLDPQDFIDGRAVQTHLNGDVVQDGTTADMIFDVPALVAHVSSVMTLLPGDVILTGTPEGVGPMQVGDEVEISIAGIGALTNPVARRN